MRSVRRLDRQAQARRGVRIAVRIRSSEKTSAGYDLDIAYSKRRDLAGGPRSHIQGGNHETNRASFSGRANRIDEARADDAAATLPEARRTPTINVKTGS